MTEPLVRLANVSVIAREQTLLRDLTFSIPGDEIVTLIGPNGAGKSTLVKLIAGLISPSEGEVYRTPHLKIGYMPQRLLLDKSLPLTIDGFLSLASRSRPARQAELAKLQISHLAQQQMHKLSGGELQRVLLARAILLQPQLLLLDEPLQGVDLAGQQALYRLIASLRDELNCAVLMVSHDLHMVMAQTDSVICLNQHVCCHGKPESVSQHPEYLRLFGAEPSNLAIYTHHHDHQHDLHGDIINHD